MVTDLADLSEPAREGLFSASYREVTMTECVPDTSQPDYTGPLSFLRPAGALRVRATAATVITINDHAIEPVGCLRGRPPQGGLSCKRFHPGMPAR